MEEFEVEIVTEHDELQVLTIMADSPDEAVDIATEMIENGETGLYGREVISASVL